MSEASAWGDIRKFFKGLDPVRVENRCEPGTPDVNYLYGWIENKWIRKLPFRGGVVKIDHYTEEQKTWAIRRITAGGAVFLILKVPKMWLIFRGDVAAQYLGKVDIEKLKEVAIKVWLGKINELELREILTHWS